MLGTDTDRAIAAVIGRTIPCVEMRRHRAGVPGATVRRPWTSEEEALVGTDTDAAIGRRIGRNPGVVAANRDRLRKFSPDAD